MKKRTLIVVTMTLAMTALVWLARRPEGAQKNSPPPEGMEAVSGDRAAHPDHGDAAGRDALAHRDSSIASPSSGTTAPGVAPGASTQPNANPLPPNVPVTVGARTFVPKAPPPQAEPEAAIELDKVRLMLRDYRTLYHENPVGTNAEIMRAVMGGNPKQARLGPPEGQTLSADGELLDRWGTPYFFHQLSSDLMEVRSAGPDKTLWTSDDIVTK